MSQEPIRTPAAFTYEHALRSHRRRMKYVIGAIALLTILGVAILRADGDRLVDFLAGIVTGLIVGTMFFLVDSWSELGARQVALAAMVHQSSSLRGLDLGDGACLEGLYLGDKDLRSAKLRAARCQGVVFCNSQLVGIDLRDADLQGADLSDTNLNAADLRGADLRGANLAAADATAAKLKGADVRGANFDGACLRKANLTDVMGDGASLRHADLSEATLQKTSLVKADLTYARLVGTSLIGTKLVGANLSFATLDGAIMIQVETRDAKLQSATITPQTLRETSLTSVGSVDRAVISADVRDAVEDVATLGHNISFSGSTVPVDELTSTAAPPDATTVPDRDGGTRFQPENEMM